MSSGRCSGIVLCGGRGSRCAGRDKGLLRRGGRPLVLAAVQSLAPYVVRVWISANRHRSRYAALGLVAVPDRWPGFRGPLAGVASALFHVTTPYAFILPCDDPGVPPDLMPRLWRGLRLHGADICVASCGGRLFPLHAVMKTRLRGSLAGYLNSGDAGVQHWLAGQRWTAVRLAGGSLSNLNTTGDLRRARRPR